MDEDEHETSWGDYARTSPIMSNVPVTSHPSERIVVTVHPRPPVWNGPVLLLAAMPLLWVALNAVLGSLGGLRWWVIITTLLLAVAASVVAAREDERMLRADHDETAPAWRAVVPLVYLARRGTLVYRANTDGYRPLWTHLCVIGGLLLVWLVVTLWGGLMMRLASTWAYYGL